MKLQAWGTGVSSWILHVSPLALGDGCFVVVSELDD
jgi:hypothetical protein